MATIKFLSTELINIILGYKDISFEDIINFICVCKQFQWAAKDNKYCFLKEKYIQRWPSAKELYDEQFKENEQESEKNAQQDKKHLNNFIETGQNYAKELRDYMTQIIQKRNNSDLIDNSIRFTDIFDLDLICDTTDYIKCCFLMDEIYNLLIQYPQEAGCDLTKRYCNIKLYNCLKNECIPNECKRFKELSDKKQLLEQCAIISAQGFQPQKNVSYSDIKDSLDSIALEVLNCLKEKSPDHSIFSTSAEFFTYWKNNNIDESHWDKAEAIQIMITLEEYIFGKLNFRPTKLTEPNYMCIDYVLENKCGRQIIILIIYHSVARRLGLRCGLVELGVDRYNICVFWKPRCATDSLKNVIHFTIDFNTVRTCLIMRPCHDKFDIMEVERIRILIVVQLVICKESYIEKMLYTCGINTYKKLKLQVNKTYQLRPQDVRFAVGMIVTFGHEHTGSLDGVIIGWHRYVDSDNVNFDTFELDTIHTDIILPLKFFGNHLSNDNFMFDLHKGKALSELIKRQTHYIILSENNEMCYVEEDAIILTTPKWINNIEIGRYFYKFENTHYVPNEMLAKLYPHDAAILRKQFLET